LILSCYSEAKGHHPDKFGENIFMWKENVIDLNASRFFEISARVVLSLLIVAILMAILAGNCNNDTN